MALLISLAFLGIGFLAGYLGQHSRMCFIGGFRDFLLVRDRGLLEGLIAFFITSWVIVFLFRVFGLIVTDYPLIPDAVFSVYGIITLAGGIAVGFAATLSGGCPLRHHVLFGQGRIDSLYFFVGFYAGIVIFYKVLVIVFPLLF